MSPVFALHAGIRWDRVELRSQRLVIGAFWTLLCLFALFLPVAATELTVTDVQGIGLFNLFAGCFSGAITDIVEDSRRRREAKAADES